MTEGGKDANWFEIRAEAPRKKRQPPRWQRQFAITYDGEIFVSAAISGRSEMEVMLCAGYDGTSCYSSNGHLYFPLDWMEREFPHDTWGILRDVIKNCRYERSGG